LQQCLGKGITSYDDALIALSGVALMVAAALALREPYRTEKTSNHPCTINEKWDCSAVDHRPFCRDVKGAAQLVKLRASSLLSGYLLLLVRDYETRGCWAACGSPCTGFSLL